MIASLDESMRTDVARRIATMDRISPEVVQEVAAFLEQKLAAVLRAGVTGGNEMGGLSSIVAILNQTERASEQQILSELETVRSRAGREDPQRDVRLR